MDGHYLCPGPLNDDTGGVEMIGLLFFLFILLYLLFGYFLYGYIRGWGPGKRKSLIITLVIMLGVPFGDVIPGKVYLKYLCATESGINISRTIDVSGYYVADRYFLGCASTCVEELKNWHKLGKHLFIESQVLAPRIEAFVEKPGFYRFQMVRKSEELCTVQDSLMQQYPVYFEKYRIPEGYCIYGEKIEKPSTDYIAMEWQWDTNYSKLSGIARVRSLVENIGTGNILGSNTGFVHMGGWLRRWFAGFMALGNPDECIDHGEYGFTWSVLRGVFNSN